MSEKDLELLVALDEPEEEEDIHELEFETSRVDRGPFPVVFGEGDWTCTLSKLTVTADGPNRQIEVGICTVTCAKQGQIVEQKVFYDLVEIQSEIARLTKL